MDAGITELEEELDSFDADRRREALEGLVKLVGEGAIELPEGSEHVNTHYHSFYSYNYLGYSPSHIAWRARRAGLGVAGLVDFDVLDGIDEFFRAGELLGLKTVAGMETRVYVPEFADREMTSPGEPGITYHMGTGFLRSGIDDPEAVRFAGMLRENAQKRNRAVLARVNAHLDPVVLDYEAEVLPLSPAGTPTERHVCSAYEKKAEEVFADSGERAKFWAERLDTAMDSMREIIGDSRKLQGLIRLKTMKKGGVGYVQPTAETFPPMVEVNRFVRSLGGIPTSTWLDGTRQGEQDIEELLELEMSLGLGMVTVIPERNWNIKDPTEKKMKLENLYKLVGLADEKGLPVLAGTEMNAPGQRFVDKFDADDLGPVLDSLLRGAWILAGHTIGALRDGRGYLSEWAEEKFAGVGEKNDYFYRLGKQGHR